RRATSPPPATPARGRSATRRRAASVARGPKVRARAAIRPSPFGAASSGLPQVWPPRLVTNPAPRLTHGAAASEKPTLSNDGRVIVFESRADLAGDGHDTGVPQVFMYDTSSRTFARVTNEPGGCTDGSSARIKRDWRIGYVCGGTAYFTMLRANQRFRVQTDG